MNKKIITLLFAAFAFAGLSAENEKSESFPKPAETIDIWPTGQVPENVCTKAEDFNGAHFRFVSKPRMEFFPAKNGKGRGLVIVCPGGGYSFLSYRNEGAPIVKMLNDAGVNAAILLYRVPGNLNGALLDAARAVRLARSKAEAWNIDPNKIAIMGFSAGACLAAMSATQWNTPGLAERLGLLREDIRPNAGVIAYAPWDNSNTIQKDPEFYNPEVAKIAKDCTPELDFINYAGWQGTV